MRNIKMNNQTQKNQIIRARQPTNKYLKMKVRCQTGYKGQHSTKTKAEFQSCRN